jgi:serine protease
MKVLSKSGQIYSLVLIIWVCFIGAGQIVASPPVFSLPPDITSDDFVPGKIVFKIKESADHFNKNGSPDAVNFLTLLDQIGAKDLARTFPYHTPPSLKQHYSGQSYVDLSKIFEIKLPAGSDIEKAINELYRSGFVEYAQPYYLPQTFMVPDDPFVSSQYYLEKIQAFDAWAVSSGDSSIVIAIVDTGIDLFHPDLIHNIAYNYDDPVNGEDSDNDGYIDNFYGWDLGENDNQPQYNANAHGVHVSGVAGATADNGTGIAGVGFNSRLLPVKVSDQDGRLIKAYEGIVYAADKGASVINCSWGGPMGAGQYGQDIVNYAAINRDAIVIAAAGNSNNTVSIYPASYNNVLSVAATDINDHKWVNSSFGNLVDLSAPGANLLSTWVNGTYISSSGTSLAAPVVAGAAAIVRSHFPEYNSQQIAAQLKVTTDIIDTIEANIPYAGLLGTGRLNLYRALTETHHPFIVLQNLQYPDDYYQMFNPGETFELAAEFRNLLAGSSEITAILTSQSSHVEIISGTVLLGNIQSLETTDNFSNPFIIRIKETIPASQRVFFSISFLANGESFAGNQNFAITFNLDYISVTAGQLSTTINSRGNLGYNYPNLNQGIGFIYSGNNFYQSLINCAGLMIGTSTSKVVDNVYGPQEDTYTGSFFSLENAKLLDEPEFGDFQITGSFNDSKANSSEIGLKVDYNIYGFDNSPYDKFLILEYDIINKSGINQPGLHAGFFADWIIQDVRNHRASYDPDNYLGYAFSANGGNFTGIQVLNHQNVRHYAFDNQGFGGSLKISDGFTSFEKYTAMKSTRDNAGVFDKDNDISTLIGAGPFNLPEGDTLTIAFAMLAGDHMMDLQASARIASLIYNGELLNIPGVETGSLAMSINPVPFTNTINIEYFLEKPSNTEISIFSVSGKHLISTHPTLKSTGWHKEIISALGWESGTYIVRLKAENQMDVRKIIKK